METVSDRRAPVRSYAAVITSVFVLSGLFLVGCKPGDANVPRDPALSAELKKFDGLKGQIDIAGGTAHIPVMTAAVKRINAANPDIRITVAGGGSGVGIKKLGEGIVNIGNTGRAITEQEKEAHGLVTFPFALDGVAIVVHPSNPVTGLTADQMKKIYAEEITNWKDVGGADGPIHLFTRDEVERHPRSVLGVSAGEGHHRRECQRGHVQRGREGRRREGPAGDRLHQPWPRR